jgi:hypothetical protein
MTGEHAESFSDSRLFFGRCLDKLGMTERGAAVSKLPGGRYHKDVVKRITPLAACWVFRGRG